MESNKIEIILEKYLRGGTSIAEENELKNYFSLPNIPKHLEHYKPMFSYFSNSKKQEFKPKSFNFLKSQNKKRNLIWMSIAASIAIITGIGTYNFINQETTNQELGTYDNPELAFKETQKALALLSTHVNTGIESVQYIEEYETSKNLIFKQ